MIKKIVVLTLTTIGLASCGKDCDPGSINPDKALQINSLVNGRSITKTTGGQGTSIPPDSVKIYVNESTNATNYLLVNDSIIVFGNYTKQANATIPQSIKIVYGNRGQDVISFDAIGKTQQNNCGDVFNYYEVGNVKVNNVGGNSNIITINK